MKLRFVLFRRGSVFYSEDTVTKKQESLHTKDRGEAQILLAAKNEAVRQTAMNLQMAQIYLRHSDGDLASRTWQKVMDAMSTFKKGYNSDRYRSAYKSKAFDPLRDRKLIETKAEHFIEILNAGTVTTNAYLRRLHNFALGMQWLPWPVLPKLHWPAVKHKDRRAVTLEEHLKIVDREHNPEIKAYYQLLWHLGGAQTDIAQLTAEDVNWNDRTISYSRNKTGVPVIISFGPDAGSVLEGRPRFGKLFPQLARIHEKHRAKMFVKRLKTVNITGISLHSYRYAWAERAKTVGMPERFAQQALGHSSKAFARAYSKKAQVVVPSLEQYEAKVIPIPRPEVLIDSAVNH